MKGDKKKLKRHWSQNKVSCLSNDLGTITKLFCEQLVTDKEHYSLTAMLPFPFWNKHFFWKVWVYKPHFCGCLCRHIGPTWKKKISCSEGEPHVLISLNCKITYNQQWWFLPLMQWHGCVLIWHAWPLTVWCQPEHLSGGVFQSVLKVYCDCITLCVCVCKGYKCITVPV